MGGRGDCVRRREPGNPILAWRPPPNRMLCRPLLRFAVVDPTEVARRDQVVDMYVPKRGLILGQVLAKQSFELTQARHLGAAETEPARYLGEVAPAVGRVHGVAAVGPEFMRFGPIPTVVDDADQQLDVVAPHSLQLLDVLIKAAVAVDQHDLAVVTGCGDADRRGKTGPDRAEIDRD